MIVKRILCLANSRKLSGRCVAGKLCSEAGAWIRPVSSREHEEVSEQERQFEDGSDPQLCDIMDVPLLEPRPKGYQQENWLLDPNYYWVKVGKASWADIKRLVDPVAPLWINGHSTFNGSNDKIPLSAVGGTSTSLRLVHVRELALSVFKPGEAFGNPKRRVQGRFKHDGIDYHLWVTDPDYERTFLAKVDGDYQLGEGILTISLGEPHEGNCYKLIAAIIEAKGAGA